MFNEFVQVTDCSSKERFLVNLSDIAFVRENKDTGESVISLKSSVNLYLHVKESFDSLIELVEEQIKK